MVGEPSLCFSVLGSGSSGNSVLVCGGATRVLVDAGLSLRETRQRLEAVGLDSEKMDGLLLTHEHGDHLAHASRLSRFFGLPLHATEGTWKAGARFLKGSEDCVLVGAERPFRLGALEVTPVTKAHDAAEPVGFLLSYGRDTLGVFTDLGHVDQATGEALGRCTALIMEANHDPGMLARGPYPPVLKARVGGRWGHISNLDSAQAVRRWAAPHLKVLVLAHLSRRNNTPALVRAASRRALGEAPGFPRWLSVQDRPTPLLRADRGVPAASCRLSASQ